MGAALSIPTLVSAKVFLRGGETLRSETELGNLVEPLSSLQFFGIWPAGDFRIDPAELGATRILILVLVLAAVGGLVWAWSRRAWGVPLYVWTATVGCLIVTLLGSPWVDGEGAGDRLTRVRARRAGRCRCRLPARPTVEALVARRGDRGRGALVERARLPGGQPRPT